MQDVFSGKLTGCLLTLAAAFSFLSLGHNAGCHSSPKAAVTLDTGIIADGAVPQLVSRQFSFTEGPAVDQQGNVFFTDQPNDKIWKYDTGGNLSLFMDSTGRSNGSVFRTRKVTY